MRAPFRGNRAIVSVAVGEPFETYGRRLSETLSKYGEADYVKIWNYFPPGLTHQQHHYAFKFYAVKQAVDMGYKRVLWLDSQVYATGSLEPVWKAINDDGYLLDVEGAPLSRWCSDECLDYFKTTRDEAENIQLLAGTWLGLNLSFAKSKNFYQQWGHLAKTPGGMFMSSYSKHDPGRMRSLPVSYAGDKVISTDPRVLGHRSDEACFSLMAKKWGMIPSPQLFNGLGVLHTLVVPDSKPSDIRIIGGRSIDMSRLQDRTAWSLDAGDEPRDNPKFISALWEHVPVIRFLRSFSISTEDIVLHMKMKTIDISEWALVKLDSHESLLTWPGSIARQISFKFGAGATEADREQVFKHLGQWYDVAVRTDEECLMLSRGRKV